jgi:H+-translocating NAD(P) transhydrogenase subunit alpha
LLVPSPAPATSGARCAPVSNGPLKESVNATAPDPIPRHFTVLMLSIVIGYYVIGKVAHALHTPLMSVTNAISGVVVVGALLLIATDDALVRGLSTAAILLASINIFGGFAVTRRMLAMFSKGN